MIYGVVRKFGNPIAGYVTLFQFRGHADKRGVFFESWKEGAIKELDGIKFVQDNLVRSKKDALRGLHYGLTSPQGKLVTCVSGEIYDVVVDITVGSPTYGLWTSFVLKEGRSLWVPPGFAHGYLARTNAVVHYRVTDVYDPKDQMNLSYCDPDIGIYWPEPSEEDVCYLLSTKDEEAECLFELAQAGKLPYSSNQLES